MRGRHQQEGRGQEWGQETKSMTPALPREQCTLMFCEKGGMSYHNHEGKHHAAQSLDQC